jgi:putative ABC transport system permease protein
MGREPLAASLNLTDAFNDVVVRLDSGAQPVEVIRRLDLVLAPYGGIGAYGRDQQISDRFVSNEIDQLRTMVEVLPPIFLAVAAFLLNIVLGRLVDTEREVIGLMKAFGFRSRTIMFHYAGLALLLSAGGLMLGYGLGAWLGRELAAMYQHFFVFPFLEFRAGADVYLIAAAATLAAVLAGALGAVRRVAALAPAEAMRPATPPDFSGKLSALARRLGPDEPSRIILRGLLRRPVRSGLTVAGLAAALALYVASASATDNIDRLIDIAFGRAQREDLAVTFAEPRDARALYELGRLPGVIRVEPFRSVGARLIAGPRAEREGLTGSDPAGDLGRLVDLHGRVVEPPVAGTVLSARLARRLEVKAGDRIVAAISEGDRRQLDLQVIAVVETPLGVSARVERANLNRLMREGSSLSGAWLTVDPARLPSIYARLKETPMVAAVTSRETMLQGVRETVAENMGIVTLFNTGFAALIVLGVVYNSARISLSERARDLASLRVLGFRRSEVGFVLIGEQALLVLASLPFGLLLGIGLSRYLSEQFSADLYTIPSGVFPATLAEGVLVVAAAAGATAVLIRNHSDRLDLVRALKTRE